MVRSSGWTAIVSLCVVLGAYGQTTTTTQVATSSSPSMTGQSVTFTATVTATQGTVPDGENVTFYDGTTQLGTGTLAAGVTSYSTFALKAKTHTIVAKYLGDATFGASSGMVQQVIKAYTSTTSLTAGSTPSTYGQPADFEATVTPSGPFAPSGTMTFLDGSTVIGSAKVYPQGLASLHTSNLAVGSHSIKAKYSGDSWNGQSVSTSVTQVVVAAASGVKMFSFPNASKVGQTVKMTATVTSPNTPATGTVTFMDGSSALSTVGVSSGKATYSTSGLSAGLHFITAVYNDASNGTQATSPLLAQNVQNSSSGNSWLAQMNLVGGWGICPDQYRNIYQASWGGGKNFYIPVLNSPPQAIANHYELEFYDPVYDALYTCYAGVSVLDAAINYGRLSAFQIVSGGDLDPDDGISASVQTQLNWNDEAFVYAPGYSSVQLQVTFTMTNAFSLLSGDLSDCYSGATGQVWSVTSVSQSFNDPCSQGGQNYTNTQVLTVDTSSPNPPIFISEVLIARGGGVNGISALQDSGFHITIQPLLPGVTVISTSGIDYSLP